MTNKQSLIRKTEHTGLTVASIDKSLPFWVDVLGLELLYRRDLGGGHAIENIVGVPGAMMSNAMLTTPDGHKIELLEFRGPENRAVLTQRPCDTGAAHLAFAIDNMDSVLSQVEPAGWTRQGTPQRMPNGMVVVYVRGPDGHTIEFIEPPRT